MASGSNPTLSSVTLTSGLAGAAGGGTGAGAAGGAARVTAGAGTFPPHAASKAALSAGNTLNKKRNAPKWCRWSMPAQRSAPNGGFPATPDWALVAQPRTSDNVLFRAQWRHQ